MKYALTFGLGTLFGALAGAVIALLFAPSSGEELRANIKTSADANYAKLQDQMNKVNSDLQAMTSRAKSD